MSSLSTVSMFTYDLSPNTPRSLCLTLSLSHRVFDRSSTGMDAGRELIAPATGK